ncbi:MAG: hypothetical protein WC889_09630 [Myxococcota bacterium]
MIGLIRWVMCTLMPRSDKLPGLEDMDVEGFLRRMRKESAPFFWLGLVLGSIVFTITPIMTVFVPLPAFWLPKSLLQKHAEKLGSSRLYLVRQMFIVVRLSASLCWGADDRVRTVFALKPYQPDPGTARLT